MTAAAVEAAKSAASVMAMNNIYYRFVRLASNPEYKTMPARLHVDWLGNPRVDRTDFELWPLAVSAINGCGACMDAHEKALRQSGVSSDAIQTAVRFAAIVQSVAVAIEAARHGTSPGRVVHLFAPFVPSSPGMADVEAHIHELSSPKVLSRPNYSSDG